MRLGKDGSSTIIPIELKCQKNTFGLGYKPKKEDLCYLKNKKKRKALDSDCCNDRISTPIPHISVTFIKSCYVLRPNPPVIVDLVMVTGDESSQLDLVFEGSCWNKKMMST